MATYYLDSSALVKRYAWEVGSSWIIGLTDPNERNEVFISLVAGAEVVAAISRRARMALISPEDAALAIGAFRRHLQAQYQVVSTTSPIVERATDLAIAHGLRGYDAIQLASALAVQAELAETNVGSLVFVSADINLNIAAQAEGLAVENPNDYP